METKRAEGAALGEQVEDPQGRRERRHGDRGANDREPHDGDLHVETAQRLEPQGPREGSHRKEPRADVAANERGKCFALARAGHPANRQHVHDRHRVIVDERGAERGDDGDGDGAAASVGVREASAEQENAAVGAATPTKSLSCTTVTPPGALPAFRSIVVSLAPYDGRLKTLP